MKFKLLSDSEHLQVYIYKGSCNFEKVENTELNRYLQQGYEIDEIHVTSSLTVVYIKKQA